MVEFVFRLMPERNEMFNMAKKEKTEENTEVKTKKSKPLGGTILAVTVGVTCGVILSTNDAVQEMVQTMKDPDNISRAVTSVTSTVTGSSNNTKTLTFEELALSLENLEVSPWESVYPELEGVLPNPTNGVMMPIESSGWHLYEVDVKGLDSAYAYIKMCSAYGFTVQPMTQSGDNVSAYMEKDGLLVHVSGSSSVTTIKVGLDPEAVMDEDFDLEEIFENARVSGKIAEVEILKAALEAALEEKSAEEADEEETSDDKDDTKASDDKEDDKASDDEEDDKASYDKEDDKTSDDEDDSEDEDSEEEETSSKKTTTKE